jgi:hypothetical protein
LPTFGAGVIIVHKRGVNTRVDSFAFCSVLAFFQWRFATYKKDLDLLLTHIMAQRVCDWRKTQIKVVMFLIKKRASFKILCQI